MTEPRTELNNPVASGHMEGRIQESGAPVGGAGWGGGLLTAQRQASSLIYPNFCAWRGTVALLNLVPVLHFEQH